MVGVVLDNSFLEQSLETVFPNGSAEQLCVQYAEKMRKIICLSDTKTTWESQSGCLKTKTILLGLALLIVGVACMIFTLYIATPLMIGAILGSTASLGAEALIFLASAAITALATGSGFYYFIQGFRNKFRVSNTGLSLPLAVSKEDLQHAIDKKQTECSEIMARLQKQQVQVNQLDHKIQERQQTFTEMLAIWNTHLTPAIEAADQYQEFHAKCQAVKALPLGPALGQRYQKEISLCQETHQKLQQIAQLMNIVIQSNINNLVDLFASLPVPTSPVRLQSADFA